VADALALLAGVGLGIVVALVVVGETRGTLASPGGWLIAAGRLFGFIGAGAVVTGNVPDFALMVGVPARRRGWMCQCGARLSDGGAGRCHSCGSTYELTDGSLRQLAGPNLENRS